ncbi:MAG: formimidoylglutamase [Planctomycetes bacterium]|nr:formimidoylglutamase [Planctomycetota bacterium]
MPEPDMSVWTGRVDVADGPNALRWHQMVKPLTADSEPGIVLIGFACDEGVRRNGGRVGAKDGPQAIRKALANLAWHQAKPVYDAGDVRCDDADMEGSQSRLADVVAKAIWAGHRPLILGGGHETAWGTFQGIARARPNSTVGIINIDAHLDLRADEPGNSGTPFNQMAKWCEKNGRPFRYLCLGVATPSNTIALFNRASELGAQWCFDYACDPWYRSAEGEQDFAITAAGQLAAEVDWVYLSVDLDVLPAAVMPGVSAPANRGVSLEIIQDLASRFAQYLKVIAVDVVELNPTLDIDLRAAKVASGLVWYIASAWPDPGPRNLTHPRP